MPRSYSFDHFTAVKPDSSKVETATGSHHPVKSETPMPEHEGIHYGRQHAQTVARAQARRMDHEAEQRLAEETGMMDEEPPAELASAPRKRAGQPRKLAGAKQREHHTSVARRGTSTRKAASAQKKATAQPARKTTRGTKEVARTGAMARTARGGKQRTAKTPTTRGTPRRTPKRR
jgi:hypothetical protein